MRKVLTIGLILVILLTLCVPCFAADAAVVRGEALSALAGQTVEYRVSISGNPGLAGFQIQLYYDEDALEIVTEEGKADEVAVTRGEALGGGSIVASKIAGGCRVFWYSVEETAQDGVLFSVRLKTADSSAQKTYPIRLTYSQQNTVNAAEESVPLQCEGGSIRVRTFTPLLYSDPAEVMQGEEFDCTIRLQDNPGLASCGFMLLFDQNAFEVVMDTGGEPVVRAAEAFASGTLVAKKYRDGVQLLWYSVQNTDACGDFITVRLRAKSAAPVGKQTIRVSLDASQTLKLGENEQVTEMPLDTQDGAITIRSSAKVQLRFPDTHTAVLNLTSAAASYAAAAFYQANGQMVAASFTAIDAGAAQLFVKAETADLQQCGWKLFLLDAEYQPICVCSEASEF